MVWSSVTSLVRVSIFYQTSVLHTAAHEFYPSWVLLTLSNLHGHHANVMVYSRKRLVDQQLMPHCCKLGPLTFAKNGSMRTHRSENMDARRIDHTITIVGVRFCRPINPFRKGYKCTITQNAKKSFPNKGPHDW